MPAGTWAGRAEERWLAAYRANTDEGPFSIETAAMARRALKNLALAYLVHAGDAAGQTWPAGSTPGTT